MPDRLDELRRQRALVQQHLAWLDAEIAAAQGGATPAPAAPAARVIAPGGSGPAVPAVNPLDAEALLARYGEEERFRPGRLKLGCWIAFLLAFAAFWGAVGVWYLLKTRA